MSESCHQEVSTEQGQTGMGRAQPERLMELHRWQRNPGQAQGSPKMIQQNQPSQQQLNSQPNFPVKHSTGVLSYSLE